MTASTKSFFTGGTIIVPVAQTVTYNCSGQLFICKEADAAFKMSFNDGEFFPMEVGLGFRLSDADQFRKLSFYNDTASIITIQFYVGVGEIRDARLNTIISRLSIISLKDAPDYTRGQGIVGAPLIATALGTTFSGTDPVTGKTRKQIVIQNVDAGNIWVTDANSKALAFLSAGQVWTMQSAGTFKVYRDPNGGNQNYLCAETFYTT